MSAHSEEFPWPSYYGHFHFFDARMRDHDKIKKITILGDGKYRLMTDSWGAIRVFICECYSFGVAEYLEVVENLGEQDVIIISSVWCGYTYECKEHCRDKKVGLFSIGDFMSALNTSEYWNYLNEDEKDHFSANRKI